MDTAESPLRIACLQLEPRIGEKPRKVETSLAMLADAAKAGAGLALLPELANSGYVFAARAEALGRAGRPHLRRLGRVRRAPLPHHRRRHRRARRRRAL